MSKVNITRSGNEISVSSPFNPAFVRRAKYLGGKWNAETKVWTFDARDEEDVRALCLDIYGIDGSPVKLVDVRVTYNYSECSDRDAIYFCGREIARAWGRDSGAKLGNGVKLVKGKVHSGGSVKNWATIIEKGTVLVIRDVPEPIALRECGKNDLRLVEILPSTPVVDIAALKVERDKLVARIAEIDSILSEQAATAA